jgi:hypothetical protein
VVALTGLCADGQQARAGTVEGLYEAEVPVAGQDQRDRERALRAALLEVVVRVSGQRRVTPTGVLSSALQSPSRYVQEYGYGALPRPGGPPVSGGQRLWARFNPSAVNELVRQAGLPVWGRTRPTTLVWLATEREGQRELLGPGDPGPLPGVVQTRARARGVPLVLPALDAPGGSGVRVEDVWNDQPERVASASRRAGADAFVLGKARERVPGLWETRWTVVAGEKTERFGVDGEQIDKVIAEGLDRTVDLLASSHAQATRPAEGPLPELTVTGIGNFAQYARVRRLLEGVEGVSAIRLVRAEPGRATFALKAHADREELSRLLAAGGVLAPAEGTGGWTFQLLP